MSSAISHEALIIVPKSFSLKKPGDPVASIHKVPELRRAGSREAVECASTDSDEAARSSEEESTHQWRALDQLLRNSFGLISPAYFFISFPPLR